MTADRFGQNWRTTSSPTRGRYRIWRSVGQYLGSGAQEPCFPEPLASLVTPGQAERIGAAVAAISG